MVRLIPIVFTLIAAAVAAGQFVGRAEVITIDARNVVFVTAPVDDFDRIFVLQRMAPFLSSGRILILDRRTGDIQASPFLDVESRSFGEGGLLGMAFHPHYSQNGYFYLYLTTPIGYAEIQRYRAVGDPRTAIAADALSKTTIIQMSPDRIHVGGWLEFGPDGFLYLSLGDRVTVRTGTSDYIGGSILRLDVDGADNIPGNEDDDGFPNDDVAHYTIPVSNPQWTPREVWAREFRNPWRGSFDPVTGDIFIGDVGERTYEEINRIPAGAGGLQFGWPRFEGPQCRFECDPVGREFPVYAIERATMGGVAVVGGYVYRGCAIPGLSGKYVFADISGVVHCFDFADGVVSNVMNITSMIHPDGASTFGFQLASLGRDALGEIYLCNLNNGTIWRLRPDTTNGLSTGDYNLSGCVGLPDLAMLIEDWNNPYGMRDVDFVIQNWGNECLPGCPVGY